MVKDGDDLVAMFLEVLGTSATTLEHRDLVIVTSKVVSKAEGRVVDFDGTEEHKVALIEGESARILRRRGPAAHHRDAPRLHQRQRRYRPLQHRRRHGGPVAQGPRPIGAAIPGRDPATLRRRGRGHHH